jgi:methionyl-tRNA synthetase
MIIVHLHCNASLNTVWPLWPSVTHALWPVWPSDQCDPLWPSATQFDQCDDCDDCDDCDHCDHCDHCDQILRMRKEVWLVTSHTITVSFPQKYIVHGIDPALV